MPEADDTAPHLTDAEIEAYWKGELSGADEERLEEHYVGCAECGARVAALETLIESLRVESLTAARVVMRVRAWQYAAALFAALAVGAAWQWARAARGPENALTANHQPPTTATARVQSDGLAALIVPLAPPTRGQSGGAVSVSSDVNLVLFELDVREADISTPRFDVTLADAAGRVVLRLMGLVPTDTGILRVPVDASLLTAGDYIFTATTGLATVAVPILIRPAGSG